MSVESPAVDVMSRSPLAMSHAVLSCDDLAVLMGRITVAAVCDRALAGRIVEGLSSRMRLAERPATSIEDIRRLFATAAFHAALPFAGHARPDEVASELDGAGPLAVLRRLPPIARVVVVLRELEAMSFDDIGRVVGTSAGRVATELFRARRALGEALSTVECLR